MVAWATDLAVSPSPDLVLFLSWTHVSGHWSCVIHLRLPYYCIFVCFYDSWRNQCMYVCISYLRLCLYHRHLDSFKASWRQYFFARPTRHDSARSWLLRLLELRLTNFPTYLLTYLLWDCNRELVSLLLTQPFGIIIFFVFLLYFYLIVFDMSIKVRVRVVLVVKCWPVNSSRLTGCFFTAQCYA